MNEITQALSLIRKHVKLPLGKNNHYKQNDFFWLLALMNSLNTFAEGVSNAFRTTLPQADDLFHHLKKMTVTDVQTQFNAVIKENIRRARRQGLLGKPAWLALDVTGDPYYGKPNAHTRGGKEKAGTHWFYQYLTASIVEDGQRFVISVLPFTPLDAIEDVLTKALVECQQVVCIECLLLDKGFFTANVLRLLSSKRLDYVMPAVNNKRIAKLKKNVQAFPATLESELNGVPIRLVFVMEGEDVLAFCTNRVCWNRKLAEYYSWRWGIETGFRVTDGVQARTCSRSVVVRIFIAYFAVAFYNGLQLAKALVPRGKTPIALALRLFVLMQVFVMAGWSPP